MKLSTCLFAVATFALGGCGSMSEYEHVETPRAAAAPPPSVGVTSSEEVAAERARRQAPGADAFDDTDPSALTDFKPALDPYGTWVEDATYGTVWVPASTAVGADFAPYVTNGHWSVDQNDDYLWVSDYDNTFGWATFHYGRWVWIDSRGWSWIPGRRYAPAWVVWRAGDPGYDYVGWAPAPPYYYWHTGAVVYLGFYPPAPYVFCHTNYLFRDHVGTYLVDRGHVAGVANATHTYATPGTGAKTAGGGHVLATPQHGPSAASGHIPASSWPSPASRVASASGSAFASPSAMGRTRSFGTAPTRAAGNGFGSPTRGSNQYTPGHAMVPRSLGATTSPSASHGYSPGHSSYGSSPYGRPSAGSYGGSYGGARSYGGGSYGGGSYGGGGHTYGGSFGGAPAPTTTPSTSSHHSSSSSPPPARSSGGGFRGGGRGGRGRLGRHFMKRTALVIASVVLGTVVGAGCLPDDSPRTTHFVQQPPPAATVVPAATPSTVSVVTGGTLTTEPGKGAGVFVEYIGQGQWSVWTSCDSAVQGGDCKYDLYLTPESGTTVTGAVLDPQAGTLTTSPSRTDAHWITSYGTNTVNVTLSTPGAGLLVEAQLDGVDDPHVFYWQGPDVLHTGAPSDPVLFVPTAPLHRVRGEEAHDRLRRVEVGRGLSERRYREPARPGVSATVDRAERDLRAALALRPANAGRVAVHVDRLARVLAPVDHAPARERRGDGREAQLAR